ncbi:MULTISPECIES: hypothetical protein [Erysipelothrix]|uniref:hypothetical protein n=1 Tax=Erysipelothrix TaxID=1647 RepID=UPI001377CB9D|nr:MULTISPECIES: hypothetical protein [unclassified Erysipelothrix]MBK2402236.1 hypothetical protein [Erysipelothrix sp. strain 2 (EsS2-6-Brazil)]MBK2404265.1 hypothetical protein [Erysipelothrix sp. strain 2 (EsS2-7-Brazil)]NBA01272.1 hypothetical protein [Erysipelothrix rhusiopathiae]
MSSIAYISDEKMIEYHRINGNQTVNFWRLSLKGFERFDVGDLLFFLDKRYIHPQTKEKGIIGYGRAKTVRTMSVKRTWDQYGTMNGYTSFEMFEEAILNRTKDHEVPKQIQSIELEDLKFFAAPIYLHEVDFKLTKRLESFTYLEDDDQNTVLNLLNKGLEIGLDEWFTKVHKHELSERDIIQDLEHQRLRDILSSIRTEWTLIQESMISTNQEKYKIGPIGYTYYGNKTASISLPCSSLKNQIYPLLGISWVIKKELEDFKFSISLCIKNQTASQSYKDLIQQMNLELVDI